MKHQPETKTLITTINTTSNSWNVGDSNVYFDQTLAEIVTIRFDSFTKTTCAFFTKHLYSNKQFKLENCFCRELIGSSLKLKQVKSRFSFDLSRHCILKNNFEIFQVAYIIIGSICTGTGSNINACIDVPI